MTRRVWLPALVGALALVLAFANASAEDKAEQWITLRDGVKARLLSALEDVSGERELNVNFVLGDPAVIADHTKVILIADQLFARVVVVPADAKGFKRAAVNLLMSETTTGDTTVQMYEDFHYKRGDDAVWLRQAGPEEWKVAQDPAWTAPKSKTLELTVGAVYIDFFGEIAPPPGATKALGIEMRSAVPATNIHAKYAEVKELWLRLDKEKVKTEGFDFVRIEDFGEPRRGRFHVRQSVYLNVARPPGGDWPDLPETMPNLPLIAGLGTKIDDEPTQLAKAGVAAAVVVPVAAPREPEGVTASTGIAPRALPGTKAANLVRDYLKVK